MIGVRLPGGHKFKVHKDGRVSFPTIVQYDVDGELCDLPPGDGTWKLKVHDQTAYEIIAGMQLIYHPAHVGTVSESEDHRVAPGA